MQDSTQGGNSPFDLSELTDFQFGPAWARKGEKSESPSFNDSARRGSREGGRRPNNNRPRRDGEQKRSFGQGRSERSEGRRDNNRRDGGRGPQRGERRFDRPQREVIPPTEGLRVELRPANVILELFAKEIQKHKRALPLLEVAKVVMAAPERTDLVFMKLEEGPSLIKSKKGEHVCWLTEAEALSSMWGAQWMSEFYASESIDCEAPKGTFNAIATCPMGNEVIGPVNWHGYQAALLNLHKSKYSRMPFEAFRNKITLDKSEETIAAWQEAASKKIVWKPCREGASDIVLEDAKAVEADFLANHYADCFEVADKVFINCATPRKNLSPGLAAHLSLVSEKTRRFPQMLIANLCHGLARHHLPIFKWQGNHYTGPSRIRVIPAETILADRMMAIVNWCKANSGKQVELMFSELSGVATGEAEATQKAAAEAHAPYAADMIWLLEQGYLVVTSDNAIWDPKGEATPPKPKLNTRQQGPARKGGKKPSPKADSKPKAKKEQKPKAEAQEAPAAEPAPEAPQAPEVSEPAES